ncbi:MAG: class I SAM-dependent methyltransferase [Kiritimatiellales bacterium]|nr:class I SAM-dependent methyltransferase [Kiritimatiellales bacterium]MCF7864023.1 class I SAM-dependent methyltransferase [Kiritimatiellales bacterium]
MKKNMLEARSIGARNRDFAAELSFWNPLFLQHSFLINAVNHYFEALPQGQRLTIYDFGCGQKPYAVFASNHEYIGIDIDIKNTSADIHADISEVPLPENSADLVVSFCVLEHVPNPHKVLCEKFRVLKEGGKVFMLVPLYWEEHEVPYDFFRFTRYGIEQLMKDAGFNEIRVYELNTSPSILGIHLARLCDKKFILRWLRFLVPAVNFVFYKIELIVLNSAKKNNIKLSNVMTFAVEGVK